MTDENIKVEESICQEQQIENEQRQLNLLNDPNYGIILCFLEKFKTVLDLPKYSYQRLETHLLNNHERIAPRLMDFHFILLKRLSLAKNTQREKFDSIITRFAYRFDLNDGDRLTETGYLQADIAIKTRILKNLLEGQFDLNQTFSKTLIDKPAREIKSSAIGRDRFGVSYWIFMDTDCFIRLFREDVDLDRTWSNVAKNREELENFIRLLITDSVVRKKFSDWTVDYEPLASLASTNEFEERYLPQISDVKDENSDNEVIKQEEHFTDDEPEKEEEQKVCIAARPKRGRGKVSQIIPVEVEIKKEKEEEEEEEEEAEPMSTDEDKTETPSKRRRGRPKSQTTPVKEEPIFNDEEKLSESMKKRRGRPPRGSIKPVKIEPKEELETKRKCDRMKKKVEIEEEITPNRRGRKRKTMVEEHVDEENEKQNEEKSLRRSSRPRKTPTLLEPASVLTSKTNSQVPATKKKRSVNGKNKSAQEQSTNGRSRRAARKSKSRRNHDDEFCLSSSSSDEQPDYISDDEYDSSDYLPNATELERDENFFACDEDNQVIGEELRTAKTAQDSTITTNCFVCSKSDRPDVLLLCDECDDAYHIDCLRPKLLSVPDGDWFCPLCEHRRLSTNLIEKLKELLINFNQIEQKRTEIEHKKQANPQRKIRAKDYSSDESQTASETEDEQEANLDTNPFHADESMLSISQTNENSNISSTFFDDSNKNISQRGRHRRTRFDMNKMLNGDDNDDDDDKDAEQESASSSSDDDDDDDDDDDYLEHPTPVTNFDLQIPKKMTRLLNTRYRPIARNDQRIQPKPIAPRLPNQTFNLNEKLGSPIIYINGEHNSQQMKSVITNSNQTLKIVRRWNDVQRRNKLRTTNSNRLSQETTSDCADENSVFCPDDASPPRSNESLINQDLKDDDSTIIRSKITLVQPTNLISVYKSSTKNLVKKTESNFDRLTRDIQYAVSEANTLTTIPKTIDQQQIKRIQKTNFSPYLTKVALRPLPVLLPKPTTGIGYKIFKSKDPPTTTNNDLSNIILTPSSSSSLLDANDEQSSSTNA